MSVSGKSIALLLAVSLSASALVRADDRLLREERYSEAFREAVASLKQRLAQDGTLHPRTVAALQKVGVIAHLGGDQRTADEVLEAALAARRQLPRDDAALVRLLIARARAARYRGLRAVAQACADEAERTLRGMPSPPAGLRADVLQERADWTRSKSFPEAIALYRRALAARREASPAPSLELADTLTWMAWHLGRLVRSPEAVTLAQEGRGVLAALGLPHHHLNASLAGILADQEIFAGRLDRAGPWRSQEAALSEAMRVKQLGGFARNQFPLDGYEWLAAAAIEAGRGEEAWLLHERGLVAAHVDFATLALWPQRDPAGWAVARRTRAELARMERGPRGWTAANAGTVVRVLELRAALLDLERRYLLAQRPRVPSRQAVEAALPPRSALVGWVLATVGEYGSFYPEHVRFYAYVLRPGRPIVWVPLWSTHSRDEYAQALEGWRDLLDRLQRAASWRRHVDADPALGPATRAWGKRNFEPLLPHLEGVDHLVMDRPMYPGELLTLPDGRSVGERFDVSYVPSALVLQLLAELPASSGLDRVLAVSGPSDPGGNAPVLSLLNVDEKERSHRLLRSAYTRDETPLPALPRLRYAALEAEAVASRFPASTVLVDQRSVEGTLDALAGRDALQQYDVVHLAGHTLTDPEPERCAIALSGDAGLQSGRDGLLEVEDILLGWQLRAGLLTLSGCQTLRPAGAARQDPLGFVPALFGSGARRVLSSLWTVDDRATAVLMDRFYEDLTGRYSGERSGYRGTPMPPARALREAKQYLRTVTDAHGRRPFEHPAYWAGFVLMGLP